MPGRSFNSNSYNYSFNGKLKDEELFNGAQDFGAREYDVRIARWWAIDPHASTYTSWSPYHFSANNPITTNDEDGRDWGFKVVTDKNGTTTVFVKVTAAVINSSSKPVDVEKMASVIKSQVTSAFTFGSCENNKITNVIMDIDVRAISNVDELKSTDHLFEIVDPGKLSFVDETTPGYGVDKRVYLNSKHLNLMKAGLIKTIAHELGHTGGLLHPESSSSPEDQKMKDGEDDKNLMHQSSYKARKNNGDMKGQNLTLKQINIIKKNKSEGKIDNTDNYKEQIRYESMFSKGKKERKLYYKK